MQKKTKKTACTNNYYKGRCVSKLTLSCSLWTFPCRPGKGTPESCWCHPSQRPSAHGSVTRGSRWHRTYWRSNPEGVKREQVTPVKLCPCPHPRTLSNMPPGHRGLSLLLMIQPQKPKRARPLFYGFISILPLCIRRLLGVVGRFWCGLPWK